MNLNDHLLLAVEFLKEKSKPNKIFRMIDLNENSQNFLKISEIGIGLEKYKDIVLKEDLGKELGGMGKTSFSLIYPTSQKLDDQRDCVYLFGEELSQADSNNLDFGLFIIIQVENLSDKVFDELRSTSFISNSIEGFSIRTIPRRFWCRIDKNVLEKDFSFEFLSKVLIYLYRKKFKNLIKSIKIFLINSDAKTLKKFLNIISPIKVEINERWKSKINNWKKRIDCQYSWACEICPYLRACKNIQMALEQRKKLEK